MWRKSFVATSVAIGTSVDDALAALEGSSPERAYLDDLTRGLRASSRTTRAQALAGALGETMLAVDRMTLAFSKSDE